jgi:hypothetical protein
MIIILILWFLCGIYTLAMMIRRSDIQLIVSLKESFFLMVLLFLLTIIAFPIFVHIMFDDDH